MNHYVSTGQKYLPNNSLFQVPIEKFIFQVRNLQLYKSWTFYLYYSYYTENADFLRILSSLEHLPKATSEISS